MISGGRAIVGLARRRGVGATDMSSHSMLSVWTSFRSRPAPEHKMWRRLPSGDRSVQPSSSELIRGDFGLMAKGNSVERVRAALVAAGHPDTILVFAEPTSTAAEAAAAEGFEPLLSKIHVADAAVSGAIGDWLAGVYVSAQNLTNHYNYGGYSGVQTSPFFGQPTLVYNPRKVDVGLNFNF